MLILTAPGSSAFGMVSVNTPSTSFAWTFDASTGLGSMMLRENLDSLEKARSTESWLEFCAVCATAWV